MLLNPKWKNWRQIFWDLVMQLIPRNFAVEMWVSLCVIGQSQKEYYTVYKGKTPNKHCSQKPVLWGVRAFVACMSKTAMIPLFVVFLFFFFIEWCHDFGYLYYHLWNYHGWPVCKQLPTYTSQRHRTTWTLCQRSVSVNLTKVSPLFTCSYPVVWCIRKKSSSLNTLHTSTSYHCKYMFEYSVKK